MPIFYLSTILNTFNQFAVEECDMQFQHIANFSNVCYDINLLLFFKDEIFVATKRFVIIRDLKIQMVQCDEQTVFEDNVMTVKYVPIYPSQFESTKVENEDESSPRMRNSEVEAVVDQVNINSN